MVCIIPLRLVPSESPSLLGRWLKFCFLLPKLRIQLRFPQRSFICSCLENDWMSEQTQTRCHVHTGGGWLELFSTSRRKSDGSPSVLLPTGQLKEMYVKKSGLPLLSQALVCLCSMPDLSSLVRIHTWHQNIQGFCSFKCAQSALPLLQSPPHEIICKLARVLKGRHCWPFLGK